MALRIRRSRSGGVTIMSHPVNDEIMENLYEQVCEEYPDLPAIEQVRLAEELFWDMAQ